MYLYRTLCVALALGLVLAFTGCSEKEGPAEKAGKKIDQAVEKAGEKVKEATDKMGKEAEELGDKVQEKTN